MADEKVKRIRSRKWFLVLLLVGISTVVTFVPPIISAWVFDEYQVLRLMQATEWLTLMSIIVSAYLGANVAQKFSELKAGAQTNAELNANNKSNIKEDDEKEA